MKKMSNEAETYVAGRAVERVGFGAHKATGRWPHYSLVVDGVDVGRVRRVVSVSLDRTAGNTRSDAWEISGRILGTREAAELALVERAIANGTLKSHQQAERERLDAVASVIRPTPDSVDETLLTDEDVSEMPAFVSLTEAKDGKDALDLGVIGEAQYALVLVSGNIYRRPASHVGTYGGWRWEDSADHVVSYREAFPELARRVEAAARATTAPSSSPAINFAREGR